MLRLLAITFLVIVSLTDATLRKNHKKDLEPKVLPPAPVDAASIDEWLASHDAEGNLKPVVAVEETSATITLAPEVATLAPVRQFFPHSPAEEQPLSNVQSKVAIFVEEQVDAADAPQDGSKKPYDEDSLNAFGKVYGEHFTEEQKAAMKKEAWALQELQARQTDLAGEDADNIHWARNKEALIGRTGIHDYYTTKIEHKDEPQLIDFGASEDVIRRWETAFPPTDNIHWARNKHTGIGRTGYHDYYGESTDFFGRDGMQFYTSGVPVHDIALRVPAGIKFHPNWREVDENKDDFGGLMLTVNRPMEPVERFLLVHAMPPFLWSLVTEFTEGAPKYCGDGVGELNGLWVDPNTGVLSGTPTTEFDGCIQVETSETSTARRTASVFIRIRVNKGPSFPADAKATNAMDFKMDKFGSATLPQIVDGTYKFTYTLAAGYVLPPGLAVDALYGTVQGIPTRHWEGMVGILITDANGASVLFTFRLKVTAKCTDSPSFHSKNVVELGDLSGCEYADQKGCAAVCLPGYQDGAGSLKCQANGVWHLAECTPVPCLDTPKYDLAFTVPLDDTSDCDTAPEGICLTQAAEGYEFGGPLDCSDQGVWILPPATPIECHDTPAFADNFVVPILDFAPCNTVPDAGCKLQCAPGYEMEVAGTSPQLNCGLDDTKTVGVFSLDTCVPKVCKSPVPWKESHIAEIDTAGAGCDTSPAAPCYVLCEEGYHISLEDPDLRPTLNCLNNAQWDIAACIETVCTAPPPEIPFAAEFDTTPCDTANESSCLPACIAGYEASPINGAPSLFCDHTGTWSTSGSCDPVGCAGTPSFGNVRGVQLEDMSACDEVPEGTCDVTCNPGNTGSLTLDCNGDGEQGAWVFGGDGCASILCGADEFVQDHVCTPCPAGTNNAGGDDSNGSDTGCDVILCDADFFVHASHTCQECPPGTENEPNDPATGPATTCTPILCGEDEWVYQYECKPCDPGMERAAGDDSSLPVNTECSVVVCGANQHVSNYQCAACPLGTENPAGGDLGTDANTQCQAILCGDNQRVSNKQCISCLPGSTNAAGDSCLGGNTGCDHTYCGENQHVLNHVCTACPSGFRKAGDDAYGVDTACSTRDLGKSLYYDVDVSKWGWDVCYTGGYASKQVVPKETHSGPCSKKNVFMGCRKKGTTNFIVGAWAPRDIMFAETVSNQPVGFLDAMFYNTRAWSFGFLAQGQPIAQNSCDWISRGNPAEQRSKMCIHYHSCGGWSCGPDVWLNNNNEYEYVMYHGDN